MIASLLRYRFFALILIAVIINTHAMVIPIEKEAHAEGVPMPGPDDYPKPGNPDDAPKPGNPDDAPKPNPDDAPKPGNPNDAPKPGDPDDAPNPNPDDAPPPLWPWKD
ncbi:hypothetical protein [Chlorobium limicola]|uniref:Uncharacterized protein n=1 Tax=Chlorobium limicola TaxID=1092 RepID=A0A101JIU6_CHLLI|nr:hypothetical protein [Chlorobium limicola]KUL27646.1 hypothetical protein ASB62_06015 [Chlorobium limicola]